MGVIGKIIKGILLAVGGFVSIIFLFGFFTQAREEGDSTAEAYTDFSSEVSYIEDEEDTSGRHDGESFDDYISRLAEEKDASKDIVAEKGNEILAILNESFEGSGYFDYNEDDNRFYMTITDDGMIEMAKTVVEDPTGDQAAQWDSNITSTMIDLSGIASEKLGTPTGIVVRTPWEHGYEEGDVSSLLMAVDGRLISEFGQLVE